MSEEQMDVTLGFTKNPEADVATGELAGRIVFMSNGTAHLIQEGFVGLDEWCDRHRKAFRMVLVDTSESDTSPVITVQGGDLARLDEAELKLKLASAMAAAERTFDLTATTAEFVPPGAKDPPPLAALAADLAAIPGHAVPGPVKPSDEAEAVMAVLNEYLEHSARPSFSVKTSDLVDIATVLVRRFPGLTRTPAAPGDPLAFAGGSNVLLEFNGDSWAALCNAASGAGHVRQTRSESETFKTPEQALAAVLRIVRERAEGRSK